MGLVLKVEKRRDQIIKNLSLKEPSEKTPRTRGMGIWFKDLIGEALKQKWALMVQVAEGTELLSEKSDGIWFEVKLLGLPMIRKSMSLLWQPSSDLS